MTNLYFTRDPFATIGNAVSLNHMYADTRNRETLYGKYIFKYHPVYGGKVELVYNREEDTVSKVEMSWYFLKMYWQLVSHNVLMLHQSKNCW